MVAPGCRAVPVIRSWIRCTEAELAWGKTVPEVVLKLGFTDQTYDRWDQDPGGLRSNG